MMDKSAERPFLAKKPDLNLGRKLKKKSLINISKLKYSVTCCNLKRNKHFMNICELMHLWASKLQIKKLLLWGKKPQHSGLYYKFQQLGSLRKDDSGKAPVEIDRLLLNLSIKEGFL